MKTGATRFYHGGLLICLCLVFFQFAVRCQPTVGGITAHAGVNLNGAGITMDSFNSADPNHSIWQTSMTYHGIPYGVYSDSLSYNSNSLPSRTANFTLATDSSVINVGDNEIYGFVNIAPGGTAVTARVGSIGDLNWVYDGTSGIEPGHAAESMNTVFYSKGLPNPAANGWQATWLPVPATLPANAYFKIGGTWANITGIGWTNVGGTQYQANSSGTASLPTPGATNVFVTYSMVITNTVQNTNWVYYDMSQLSGNLFIDAPNVVLWCSNGISLPVNGVISLNTNADVTVYTAGDVRVSGNAVIINGANCAKAFSIYDIAGSPETISFGGYGIGTGYIYAPGSTVSFSGGGNSTYGFVGAIFCNNISVTGHYSFHYDESLADESLPSTPWFTQQPAFEIVQVGSNATFSVAAAGPPPLTYQWYFSPSLGGGASNIVSGATNTSLTITNAQPANVGIYTAVAYNPYGSASAPGSLIVYTNAAATLSGAFNSTNGQFELDVAGVTRLNYTLEASTNLTDWVPVWTNESPFIYTDSNALPQRYYRAVFVQ